MATTTTLNFDIFARDRSASSTFNKFGSNVDKSNNSVKTLTLGLGTLAKAFVGLQVIQKTTEFLSDSIAEARESNKVGAQTEAVLKSTGRAAGVTAEQVGNLANKISLKAGIDDEAIQSGENLLLTFKNVRNEVGAGNQIFDRATRVIVDMSVAMGTDLKSANIQVGKALNDPIKGITALTRVGVTFTEKQKATIKKLVESGNTLKAQKIILRELNSEFKGSAKAQADPADKAKVAWENFKESIGQKLMPVLDRLLVWFTETALPALQNFGNNVSSKLGPAFDKISAAVSGMMPTLLSFGGFLMNNIGPIGAFVAVIGTAVAIVKAYTIAQAALNLVMAANPIGLVVVAIAALAAGLTYAYQHSEKFRAVVDKTFGFLKTFVPAAVGAVVNFVKSHWRLLVAAVTGPLGLIVGLVVSKWGAIKNAVSSAVSTVKNAVSNAWNAVKNATVSAWNGVKNAVTNGISKVVGFVKGLPGKITAAIGSLSDLLLDSGRAIINGLINGINERVQDALSLISDIGGKISGAFKGALGIHSPSKVFTKHGEAIGDGLTKGITKSQKKVLRALQGMANAVMRQGEQLQRVIEARSQFQSGFRSSFGGPTVFGAEQRGDGPVTVSSILGQAIRRRNQTARLKREQAKLISMGLSDSLVREMANSGEAGIAQIHALATQANRQDIKRLNQMNASAVGNVNAAARRAGGELFGDDIKRERSQYRATKKAFIDAMREAGPMYKFSIDGQDIEVSLVKRKRKKGGGKLGFES